MLDLKFIRSESERVRRGLEAKGADGPLDRILAKDEERRLLLRQVEVMKAERNRSSEEIAQQKRQGNDASSLMTAMRDLGDEIKRIDSQVRELEGELEGLLRWLPNLPHESVPVGPDASANVEIRRWGTPGSLIARPLPHWEIGERLRLLDFARASRLSGAGFSVFTGAGARLQRGLIHFMIDLHTARHGFREVSTPYLVRRECMFGTGQLPKMEEDMYRCEVDDLFLIPTAEVSITNLYREEVLREEDLPIRLVGYSPCFRREAGAAGKETRGLTRVHQFDKVELVKIVRPETSYRELESLVECAEAVLQALGDSLSGPGPGQRRSLLRRGQVLRPGGLGSGRGALARGFVVQQFRGFPIPPPRPALPVGGQETGISAHPERLRPGAPPRDHRAVGGAPDRGGRDSDPARASPVPGWNGGAGNGTRVLTRV